MYVSESRREYSLAFELWNVVYYKILENSFIFLLLATIHLQKQKSEFKFQIMRDIYVDNLITTVPDLTSATELD